VVVPSNEPVTLRLTSPDVIHGILVIQWSSPVTCPRFIPSSPRPAIC
jgi:hypothetical protein